jgi:hypothetical protein
MTPINANSLHGQQSERERERERVCVDVMCVDVMCVDVSEKRSINDSTNTSDATIKIRPPCTFNFHMVSDVQMDE